MADDSTMRRTKSAARDGYAWKWTARAFGC